MSENNFGEKQQLISKIEKFFDRSVSKNVMRYVLGGTKVSRYVTRLRDYPAYFNNIFSLAFIFAYGCLRYDNDSDRPQNLEFTKQNSLRIVNSLKKAYIQYPVSTELVQFVLSDIQFEMLQGGDEKIYEVFGKICNFRSLKYSISKYYKVIYEWRGAPSRFKMNEEEILEMFYNLLKCMTFLRNYDIVLEDGLCSFVDKEAAEFDDFDAPYSLIPAYHIVHFPEEYMNVFSLYSAEMHETTEGKYLNLTYVTGDGFNSLRYTVGESKPDDVEEEAFIEASANDYYYEIFGEDWEYTTEQKAKKNNSFIDQVHTINYKYIKNLALAISDAISINRGTKGALYSQFRKRYKDIFRDVEERLEAEADIECIKLDWDSIIVMLLIESSPTSVLETLFKENRQTFITVAENLCKRIDNPDLPFYSKKPDELDTMVNNIIQTKLVMGETGGIGMISKNQTSQRLRARAEALLIVSSLSFIHEQNMEEKTICAGNIYDNISFLNKIVSEYSAEQKIKYTGTILGETFRHLVCFYKGVLAYGEKKAEYDAAYYNSFFSDAQIASEQKKMQKDFFSAAKAEAEFLKQYSSDDLDGIKNMIQRFIGLCEDCSSSINNAGAYSHKIFAVLGKYDLLNLSEFRNYVELFLNKYNEINEDNVDKWIAFTLDTLKYLRNGSFKNTEGSFFKAVYPFAATYNKGNENYDGHRTVTFKLNFDVDGDEKADEAEYINVLTEFSYNTTNVFYCLPNVLRANKRWWIDPLLISFKEFNDIFEE